MPGDRRHHAPSFTSGNAIEIAAHFVTLDLNGHKMHGANAGSGTQAVGIHAVNRRGVTVKNGTVWGFATGIALDASAPTSLAGYVVEGIRAELNRETGIYVQGASSIVRNTAIANTGPNTLGSPRALAIHLKSDGGRVLNNDVLTVTPPTNAATFGIGTGIENGGNALVVGNRIANTQDYGVLFSGATGKYRDNLTSGIPDATRFVGGTDAGNNN